MAFSRAAILRNLRNFRGRPTLARPQVNQVARRTYASGGHEHAKAGGDAVWAAGAVAVTVPTCWFLISNKPDNTHGHGGHGDSHTHAEEHEKEEEKSDEEEKPEEKEEDKTAEAEEKTEDKEESKEPEKTDESDSDDGAKEQDTPATSDDESVEDTDKNVRKSFPDAKGDKKARLESKQAIKQGEDNSPPKEDEPEDKPRASKEPGGKNTQSGKQEGLSNTDTKHSTDITNNPSKSQKLEGAPETARLKGTVDPARSEDKKESDS